jgi:hypothetical protein
LRGKRDPRRGILGAAAARRASRPGLGTTGTGLGLVRTGSWDSRRADFTLIDCYSRDFTDSDDRRWIVLLGYDTATQARHLPASVPAPPAVVAPPGRR